MCDCHKTTQVPANRHPNNQHPLTSWRVALEQQRAHEFGPGDTLGIETSHAAAAPGWDVKTTFSIELYQHNYPSALGYVLAIAEAMVQVKNRSASFGPPRTAEDTEKNVRIDPIPRSTPAPPGDPWRYGVLVSSTLGALGAALPPAPPNRDHAGPMGVRDNGQGFARPALSTDRL